MEDERLSKINSEKEAALKQSNDFYNNLLTDNENLYNQKNEYANQWENTQNNILDKQLAYQTDLINQQKEEARKTKETEAKSALNDYAAYVNPYGYQAERIADNGLSNAGVSETSKLGAYTTYQNRLASANKAMQDAFTSFDNDINAAILNNDVTKAQNALNKLQMQIDFADTYYGNKATYGQNQLENNQNLQTDYFNKYTTVYNQIQDEKARTEAIRQWEAEMKEKQRQFDANLAWQREQSAQEQSNWEREYALSQQSISNSRSSSSSRSSGGSSGGYNLSGGATPTYSSQYYSGQYNPDALTNGQVDSSKVFSNGYQPNNVGGNKLSKSGYKVGDVWVGAYGSTGADISSQTIWKAGNKYYVWDGSLNDYIDVSSFMSSWQKHGKMGPNLWSY